MIDFFLKENTEFTPFSGQHFWIIITLIFFGSSLIFWAKKQTQRVQVITGNILAFSISMTVIVGSILNLYSPEFNYKEDLPLHLCSFLGLTIPILSLTRKYLLYEVYLFLILSGTLQSLATPTEYNYLNFYYFRYWFVHGGLVIFTFYATIIYEMRPTLKSVFKAFVGVQIYTAIMFVINYILGSNYFYTFAKPEATTLLDVFGEWPQYVIVVEMIIVPFFLLIYLPFHLIKKKD